MRSGTRPYLASPIVAPAAGAPLGLPASSMIMSPCGLDRRHGANICAHEQANAYLQEDKLSVGVDRNLDYCREVRVSASPSHEEPAWILSDAFGFLIAHRGVAMNVPCLLPLVALAGLALAPRAKADFLYDIQSTWTNLHVRFDLPSFEQDVVDQTTFDIATDNLGPVIHFGINGGSGVCDDFIVAAGPAPCWVASGSGWSAGGPSPSFAGPGTFTLSNEAATTTVTILDVSNVPEPSSCVLLSLMLVSGGLVLRHRRAAVAKGPGRH